MTRTRQGVFSWEDVLAQRYESNKPPPLSHFRQSRFDTQFQPQCRLLSRLSPELRLMIWELALGCRRIHIIQVNHQGLGHIVCPLSGTELSSNTTKTPRGAHDPFCDICNGGGIPQPVKEGDLINACHGDFLLGLALTCQQIHNESIHLLYTLNTFEFSNPWSLPYLRPTIPTQYWASIRSIELRWSFPGHWLPSKDPVRTIYVSAGRAQWLEACHTVARLPSLRSFALVLGSTWFSEPVEKLPKFLEPLRDIKLQQPSRAKNYNPTDKQPLLRSTSSYFHSSSSPPSASGSGFSSDEDSASSLSSSSSTSIPASSIPSTARSRPPLRSCWSSSSALADPAPFPPIPKTASAQWELCLQGQPYYSHELEWMGDDLRRRGIDCYISLM